MKDEVFAAGLEKRALALPTAARAAVTWFMDIDGVLNVIGRPPARYWGDYVRTGVMQQGLMWPVVYSPRLVRILNTLHRCGVVHFTWLTTWEDDAHRAFAPSIGLDIGRDVRHDPGREVHDWWKLDVLFEQAATGEPAIFADDDFTRYSAFVDRDPLPDTVLALVPPDTRGLTPVDIEIVLDFVDDHRHE